MAKAKTEKVNANSASGIVFVGCMFLGMGGGALVGQTGAGTLLGMGVGFVAMAALRLKK